MKILHVDAGRYWRGGQNQVRLTATGMAQKGHDVHLACRAGAPLGTRAREGGLAVHEVRFGGELSLRPAARLLRLLETIEPDVVQAHDPHALTACLLAMAARRRIPLVPTRRVDFPPRGVLSQLKYRICPRVIGVSRAVLEVLRAAGLPEDQLRLVYEGVPDREPQSGGREALARLGVHPKAPVVGNIAALTDHKDHRTLLAAAAQVLRKRGDVCFVIVGEGELRGLLEERARELAITERVVFAGFRDDVDRLLPAFDVFCLSSHMEGLGTILLDAMAFGRPVVGTAAGGIPEAVEEGVTGRVVPARNPGALAQALLELLDHPERARDMGLAGRRRFEEKFSAERMVTETLAVYGEVL